MRYFAGKVLILLSIALVLGNVHCFAQCLVQPCGGPEPMHCHSEGKTTPSQCSHQHDLAAPTANSVVHADAVQVVLAVTPTGVAQQTAYSAMDAENPSPPLLLSRAEPLSLRI